MNDGTAEIRSIGPNCKTPLTACLKCGNQLDRASQINGDKGPKTGDFTICITCSELLVFDETLRFRWPTDEERAEIMQLPMVQQAIALIDGPGAEGIGGKEDRRTSMSEQLGEAPIVDEFQKFMNDMALRIDSLLNGGETGDRRQIGFILMVFPFGANKGRRCNYISNSQRADVVAMLKEQVARFEEGTAETEG